MTVEIIHDQSHQKYQSSRKHRITHTGMQTFAWGCINCDWARIELATPRSAVGLATSCVMGPVPRSKVIYKIPESKQQRH